MNKFAIAIVLFATGLSAESISLAKIVKESQKGQKIVEILCDKKKLPSTNGTIEQLMSKIKTSKACPKLSKSKLKAVAYFVSNGSMELTKTHISVPADAKCPVCGMIISKYPKWAGFMQVGDKKHYFDGVKDMMKYYIFDADFPYDRKKITKFRATDFYTLESIAAKDAYFVLGSDVRGPMGNELVPFKTKKEAENFTNDHKGQKILRFLDITPKIAMALDGIDYEQ